MNEQATQMLDEEIIRLETKLKTMEIGSEGYTKVSDLLKDLYRMRIDHAKAEWDYDEKREKRLYDSGRADEDLRLREKEAELKRKQNKTETWLKVIQLAWDAAKFVGGSTLLTLMCLAGFKFEETGVIASKTFGRLIEFVARKLGR